MSADISLQPTSGLITLLLWKYVTFGFLPLVPLFVALSTAAESK